MSFAFNAAPFSENNMDENKSAIERKRNRTIKKPIRTSSSPHVEAMMNRIHNNPDEDNDLEDFRPESKGETVENKKMQQAPQRNSLNNVNTENDVPVKDHPVSVEAFTKLPRDSSAADYYQQFIPNYYNQMSEPTSGNRELLEKLNYMIHMLEEQQNEKTGHVTEEVILYSFLGVFIIFVVDSFARAGKYIR
jgi:hypothetical protein